MADLRLARLEHANLCRANLYRANLLGAKLAGACLDDVDLAGSILPDGTRYTDEADIERFTHEAHPLFEATLAALGVTERGDGNSIETDRVSGDRDRSWSQFVERTYGSLSDDPIEWHPPAAVENEDGRE